MKKFFTPLALFALLFTVAFNVNAQIDPPYGTCDSASGPYAPPAGATMDADGNYVLYADGSNMSAFMQTPAGGTQPDNAFVFDAINYEGGVPIDTSLVISNDYTVDLAALGLAAGDVLQAYSITYDIATINDIAIVVEEQCALIETLTGNDQVCEILAEIQANGGFQSLEDAVTLAGLFFGEIPSVGEAAFQLDTLNTILINFGPILGISDQICFAYDGYSEILISTPPPPAPDNDDCISAFELVAPAAFGEIAYNGPYTNVDATVGAEDPTEDEINAFGADPCMFEDQFGALPFVNGTVWFTLEGDGTEYHIYTSADGDGVTLTDTYIDDGDTQMVIFTGGCDDLTYVDCNEDDALAVTNDYFAGLNLATEAGVTYYIMVDGFNLAGGVSDGEFFVNVEYATDPCETAFLESAEAPETVNLCPTDSVLLSVNDTTLDFGLVSDGLEADVFWVATAVDPAGANPLDLLGTDDYIGIFYIGASNFILQEPGYTEIYWTPAVLQYDPATFDLFFPNCELWGATTMITQLTADDAACVTCNVEAGTISTDDATTVCVTSGNANVTFAAEGGLGENFAYLVTDETGEVILGGPTTDATISFNDAPAGVCQVWGVWYDGELTIPSDTVAQIEGCFILSDPIAVTRLEATSAFISTDDATTVCVGNADAVVNVIATDVNDQNLVYVVTDETGSTILATSDSPAISFENAPGGVCLIWVVTHAGNLETPTDQVADITGCFALSNAIAVTRLEAQAATIATTDNTTVCVNDPDNSTVSVTTEGGVGEVAYLVTTEDGLTILAGPTTDTSFSFEGAPAGVCLIWQINYDGTLDVPTDQVTDITGCFALSNAIEVTRLECFDCQAQAGSATFLNSSYDANANVVASCEDVVFSTADFNSLSTYSQALVATQGSSLTVSAIATPDADGNVVFADLSSGTYCFHSLNYANDAAPTIPSVGESATVLFDDPNACFQLNNADNDATACIEVVILEPITYDFQKICPADDNNVPDGTYDYNLIIQGGLPGYNADEVYNLAGDVNTTINPIDGVAFFNQNMPDGESIFIDFWDATSCSPINFVFQDTAICIKLSVELLSFYGTAVERGNEVNWKTASEFENDYFTLQSSKDGINFTTIATINAAGTSTYTTAYSYIDENATAGLTYYRLLDTDYNGVTTDNGIIEVTRNANEFTINSITPVPANNEITINFDSVNQAVADYEVFDLTGKLIKRGDIQANKGNNIVKMNVADMSTGVYLLTITVDNQTSTAKLVKK